MYRQRTFCKILVVCCQADTVRKQLKDLSKKIETELQPVYTSPKIGDKLKLQEKKACSSEQSMHCLYL